MRNEGYVRVSSHHGDADRRKEPEHCRSYVGNTMATFCMQTLGCEVSAINTVNYSKMHM